MVENNSSFNYLIDRLQSFVKRVHYHQIVRGVLSLLVVVIPVAIIFFALEYKLYLPKSVRAVFYWTLIVILLLGIFYLIIMPIWKWLSTSQEKIKEDAARLIGNYFPEVQDKLLNVLYLSNMNTGSQSMELIDASIGQKAMEMQNVNFQEAIDLSIIKKLGKILGIIGLLMLIISLFTPRFMADSAYRILNYDTEFSPQAPFDFVVLNKNLKVPQYSDVILKATMMGENLPTAMSLEVNGVEKTMESQNGVYYLAVKDIQEKTEFRLISDGFYSKKYTIDIVPLPRIEKMRLRIVPPGYTGKSARVQKDNGDVSAPVGSRVYWEIDGKHISKLNFIFQNIRESYTASGNRFNFSKTISKDGDYILKMYSSESNFVDSQSYSIGVISDAHPSIIVKEFEDKVENIKYYSGDVSDDYGLTKLQFVVEYNSKRYRYKIPITGKKNASFEYSTSKVLEQFPRGAELKYYFEVWDNDAVNGAKSSKSQKYSISELTENELKDQLSENADNIQDNIKSAVNEAKQIQKELESIKKKLLQKSKLDLNDKKQIEELLKLQKELQKKLENTQDQMKRNFDKKNELSENKEEFEDQKKQLDDFSEKVKNPELQKLMEKIQKLMKDDKQDNLMEKMDEFNKKSDKMEQSLEHLKKLYEHLDYKQKLNDMIDKLNDLAEKQKELAEKNIDNEKQKELNKETQKAEKDLEKLMEKNKELNNTEKKEYEEVKKELEKAMDKQEESMEDSKGGDSKKQSQKDAGQKLEQAADKLQSLKEKQESEQNAEDYRTMRRVLENIIYLSFEQEKLLEKTKKTPYNSTQYTELTRTQKKLYDDFVTVEDSLYKVAYRQPKVKKIIFEEIDKIKNNSENAITYLKDRRGPNAQVNEQYAMASYNRLGLMISESLKNMQDENENQSDKQCNNPKPGKKGSKQCNNPKPGKKGKKGGKIGMKKLAQMQKQLNDQMEKMMKQMKNGQKPSKGGKGEKGEDGGMSKELAKMAAQQQAIADAIKQIEKTKNSPDKTGKKPMGNQLNEIIDKLNKTEQDLYDKKITQEMIKRQREIEVKMLESSKAEQNQDEEMKRKSQKARNYTPEKPVEYLRYIEKKKQNKSVIEKNAIKLTPYFKNLSDKYFELIK